MHKRIKKVLAGVAALAALALGGSVIAQGQSTEPKGGPDTDTVQSGDQTTPDRPGARESSGGSERPGAEGPEQPGSESESAPGDDGPGGHADEANGGNANADHQFQGEE